MNNEVLKKMFGVGLPEIPKSEWPEGTEEALKMMGPGARIVRKQDGSISIFSAPEFEGDVRGFEDLFK